MASGVGEISSSGVFVGGGNVLGGGSCGVEVAVNVGDGVCAVLHVLPGIAWRRAIMMVPCHFYCIGFKGLCHLPFEGLRGPAKCNAP